MALHYDPVFIGLSAFAFDDAVASHAEAALDHAFAVASPATEPLPRVRGILQELHATKGAIDRYTHDVSKISYPSTLRKYGIAGLIGGGAAATAAQGNQGQDQ